MRWARSTACQARKAHDATAQRPPRGLSSALAGGTLSLRRRLLLALLGCAPLVWGLAMAWSYYSATHEVNELFDTEQIRFARQVQATVVRFDAMQGGAPMAPGAPPTAPHAPAQAASGLGGEADLQDLSLAVWDDAGRLWFGDREGVALPWRADAGGFEDLSLDGAPWRVYYLQHPSGEWLVAVGQRLHEREELVWDLVAGQLLPWLIVLPLLIAALVWAVRTGLQPVRTLTQELQDRSDDDLSALAPEQAPVELQPLLRAMNALFQRIDAMLERERRMVADAAHELRTPLAALQAQWDVLRNASEGPARDAAADRVGHGLQRLERLVGQMLWLSRVEALQGPSTRTAVDWAALVPAAVNDVWLLAERRQIELDVQWPADGQPVWAPQGDADLLAALLRNLLDNACRYAPPSSVVTVQVDDRSLQVRNGGPALPLERWQALGRRFQRSAGQTESGSGLGLSIAQRIAALHGLNLVFSPGPGGQGFVATLSGV